MKHYKTDLIDLRCMDCMELMRDLPDNSVDSIVTDPPYGLSFMGKKWDYDVPSEDVWRECLRVLKPGGHLLAFAGTRTQHRMAVRIEDAGFEIRDMIAWVYGSGFPKSLDVSKAIDKAAGAEREVVGTIKGGQPAISQDGKYSPIKGKTPVNGRVDQDITAPATEAARQWQGWGTALKPALEPITVARKPFPGTVAANVLEHGTGAINIDVSRIPTDPSVDDPRLGGAGTWSSEKMAKNVYEGGYAGERVGSSELGRWPANLIHDGSEEVVACFPVTGASKVQPRNQQPREAKSKGAEKARTGTMGHDDNGGSAARFFYCAKASKADRDEGCEGMGRKPFQTNQPYGKGHEARQESNAKGSRNHHPTVKPTALMRYLCRLVTPPGGVVLDPFMGSGSTGKAAILEGFRFIGAEMLREYFGIAKARITAAVEWIQRKTAQTTLF